MHEAQRNQLRKVLTDVLCTETECVGCLLHAQVGVLALSPLQVFLRQQTMEFQNTASSSVDSFVHHFI